MRKKERETRLAGAFLELLAASGEHWDLVHTREKPDFVIKRRTDQLEAGLELRELLEYRSGQGRSYEERLRLEFENVVRDVFALERSQHFILDVRILSVPLHRDDVIQLGREFRRRLEEEKVTLPVDDVYLELNWHLNGITVYRVEFRSDLRQTFCLKNGPVSYETLATGELQEIVLGAVREKVRKREGYQWGGPLFLVLRNPYSHYVPDQPTRRSIERLIGSAYDAAWLMNLPLHALDASPREPQLVRITEEARVPARREG